MVPQFQPNRARNSREKFRPTSVLGWRMYVLTRDPLFLGLIGLVEAVPALGLALYAGYLVDRSRPLLVFRRVVETSWLSGFILLVSQLPSAGAAERLQIGGLFLSSFFIGSSNELGEFESGIAARLLGAVPAAVLGGMVCLATVLAVCLLSPPLRELNLHELEPTPEFTSQV